MTSNEGNLDRGVRAIVGLVLVSLAMTDIVGPWGWVGLVPLATAAMGWCPLYAMLGIDTCPARRT